jgi:hypothetical protein
MIFYRPTEAFVEDTGTYMVKAVNMVGEAKSYAKLSVKTTPEPMETSECRFQYPPQRLLVLSSYVHQQRLSPKYKNLILNYLRKKINQY